MRRLLGAPAAYLAFAFLALAPFGVALSRQLHPDGFVAGFTLLALLYFLAWLYGGRRRRDLVLSGVVMGLAWLTKTPAALLVPTGLILVAVEWWRTRRAERGAFRQLAAGYVLWGVIATAVFFAFWPAMWAGPFHTLGRMATEMEAYVEGHVNPNFYMGQPTADPGWSFYPVAFFFRITPATAIGLLLAAIYGLRRRSPFDDDRTRSTTGALLLFALLFVAAMSVPAKKFDRYILPAFLALDIVAALGWLALVYAARFRGVDGRAVGNRTYGDAAVPNNQYPITNTRFLLLAAAVVFLHGLFTALTWPYYLTYYNPLAGGSRTAPRVLFTGWGEGLDAAARWLNEQRGADDLRVAAWYADGPFSYFFDGTSVPMGYGSPLSWLGTDYAVTYVNQWQRQLPSPEAVAWFAAQTPAHEVRADGLTLARVYDLRQTLLPPFIDLNTAPAADFGGLIRLAGLELNGAALEPGGSTRVTFYLQALAAMDANYNVLVRLVAPDGTEVWRKEGWPWGAPTAGWPLREVRPDGHTVAVPADAAPGLYKLVLGFYDPADFAPLAVTDPRTGAPTHPGERDVALIRVGEPPAATTQFDAPWQFDRFFALSGATLPASAAPRDELAVAVQWDALAAPPADYTAFVHLIGPDGTLAAQQDRPPLDGFAPTHAWTPGLRLLDEFTLNLPADAPPGTYEIRAGLYGADGTRLPVSRNGEPAGDFAVLGTLEVQ
jgi:hypothetical protein